MFKTIVLVLISLVLGALRISGVTHIAFQAIAHCFVGGLIGAYVVLRPYPYRDAIFSRRFYLGLAIALSILETLCFLYFRVFRSL